MTFQTQARALLPAEPADCEGPCEVAVVADIAAPGQPARRAARPVRRSRQPDADARAEPVRHLDLRRRSIRDLQLHRRRTCSRREPTRTTEQDIFVHQFRPVDPPIPGERRLRRRTGRQLVTAVVGAVHHHRLRTGSDPHALARRCQPGDFNILGSQRTARRRSPTLLLLRCRPYRTTRSSISTRRASVAELRAHGIPGMRDRDAAARDRHAVPGQQSRRLRAPAVTPPSVITTDVQLVGGRVLWSSRVRLRSR